MTVPWSHSQYKFEARWSLASKPVFPPFLNLFFSHISCPDCSFLSISPLTLSPPSLLSPDSLPLPLPSEKSSLPGTSTKHTLTSYSRTRHMFSHHGWTRKPNRRKRGRKGRQESETPLLPVRSPEEHQAIQP